MLKKLLRAFDYVYVKVIVTIIILVFPLNIIAIRQNESSMSAIIEQTRLTTQNLADNYMNEVNTRMENSQSILVHFLQEDPNCLLMKKQSADDYEYASAKMRFHYTLKTSGGMINGADGYFYYMDKKQDVLAWGKSVVGSNILVTMNEFITEQVHNESANGWHIYELNGKNYLILLLHGKDIAYGAWLNIDDVLGQLRNGLDFPEYDSYFSENRLPAESSAINIISEKRGITLNIAIPTRVVVSRLSGYQKVMRIMVFLYLILVPLLYFFLRYLFMIPLKRINEAHAQIREGNQDYRLPKQASSIEFQDANISFNQMAENLKSLRIESYEKEISRQKMELRNLQLQVRPHFLLNTFNLIYTLIQRKEFTPIQDIVLYLSDYFRYIFRSHKELELFSKELMMIQNYVKLSGLRYIGRIDFKYEIDPELELIRIPPLLIHNFVENSIKYGLINDQILQITLIGEYEDQLVTIYVMDDGNGMDEKTLDKERKLLSGELKPENPNDHIGLVNSLKRLKYFYGEKASIEIESDPGKLMCFKIQFPYHLDDEADWNMERM